MIRVAETNRGRTGEGDVGGGGGEVGTVYTEWPGRPLR